LECNSFAVSIDIQRLKYGSYSLALALCHHCFSGNGFSSN
jgi:hypothetical protein